jgi:hypothetical protein
MGEFGGRRSSAQGSSSSHSPSSPSRCEVARVLLSSSSSWSSVSSPEARQPSSSSSAPESAASSSSSWSFLFLFPALFLPPVLFSFAARFFFPAVFLAFEATLGVSGGGCESSRVSPPRHCEQRAGAVEAAVAGGPGSSRLPRRPAPCPSARHFLSTNHARTLFVLLACDQEVCKSLEHGL